MSIAEVEKGVRAVVQLLTEYNGWVDWEGMAIRYAIVDPLLWSLGWRTWLPWECLPEFQTQETERSHYALLDRDGYVAALIDVNEREIDNDGPELSQRRWRLVALRRRICSDGYRRRRSSRSRGPL